MRALPIVFVFSLLLAAACGSDSEDPQSATGAQATPGGSTSSAGPDATASVSGDATVAEDSQGPTARPEPATPADLHRQVLSGLAESVIIPTLEAFADSTSALQQAAYAHAGDLSAESLADVQQAWHTSMGLWQQAEVMQIGPTASMSAAPEGMDMRDEIYSWPTVNTCRIDQEITEDAHADQAVFGTELANVRGLDALEYLLFAEELENSCSANSGINKKGTWEDLLTAGELPARRAAYILTAASLLESVTQSILTAWRKDGGDFHTSFATAGAGSEVYDSAQQALNRVSDALFAIMPSKMCFRPSLSSPPALICASSAALSSVMR